MNFVLISRMLNYKITQHPLLKVRWSNPKHNLEKLHYIKTGIYTNEDAFLEKKAFT